MQTVTNVRQKGYSMSPAPLNASGPRHDYSFRRGGPLAKGRPCFFRANMGMKHRILSYCIPPGHRANVQEGALVWPAGGPQTHSTT